MRATGRVLSHLNAFYLRQPFYVRLPVAAIVIALFCILSQSWLIFPGALFGLFSPSAREPRSLPSGVESIRVTTKDGQHLEVWRLEGRGAHFDSRTTALIFHGNAADVANFFPYQRFFSSMGIRSYGFDYRGYGTSTGWPSEQGLYEDGRAVAAYILEREQISASNLILVGISIGSGPAAHTAKQLHPRQLVLFSPYVSLRQVVKETPLLGLLSPFLKYEFPVLDDLEELHGTCLTLIHGQQDTTIKPQHSVRIKEALAPGRHVKLVLKEGAAHNDILYRAYKEAAESIQSCPLGAAQTP